VTIWSKIKVPLILTLLSPLLIILILIQFILLTCIGIFSSYRTGIKRRRYKDLGWAWWFESVVSGVKHGVADVRAEVDEGVRVLVDEVVGTQDISPHDISNSNRDLKNNTNNRSSNHRNSNNSSNNNNSNSKSNPNFEKQKSKKSTKW